jgi:hypothetical protein
VRRAAVAASVVVGLALALAAAMATRDLEAPGPGGVDCGSALSPTTRDGGPDLARFEDTPEGRQLSRAAGDLDRSYDDACDDEVRSARWRAAAALAGGLVLAGGVFGVVHLAGRDRRSAPPPPGSAPPAPGS